MALDGKPGGGPNSGPSPRGFPSRNSQDTPRTARLSTELGAQPSKLSPLGSLTAKLSPLQHSPQVPGQNVCSSAWPVKPRRPRTPQCLDAAELDSVKTKATPRRTGSPSSDGGGEHGRIKSSSDGITGGHRIRARVPDDTQNIGTEMGHLVTAAERPPAKMFPTCEPFSESPSRRRRRNGRGDKLKMGLYGSSRRRGNMKRDFKLADDSDSDEDEEFGVTDGGKRNALAGLDRLSVASMARPSVFALTQKLMAKEAEDKATKLLKIDKAVKKSDVAEKADRFKSNSSEGASSPRCKRGEAARQRQQAVEAARREAAEKAALMLRIDPVSEEHYRRERERAQKERRPVRKVDLELTTTLPWGAKQTDDPYEERESQLFKLSYRMKIPLDVIRSGWEIFEQFALLPGEDDSQEVPPRVVNGFDEKILNEGLITQERFAHTLCEMTNSKSVEDLPEGLFWSCFSIADADNSKVLDFKEFATWYSRYGFTQSLMTVNEEQKEIRVLARKHGLKVSDVERFRVTFSQYDTDGSGEIDFDEFRKLLYRLLGVPANLEIPERRIKQFWSDAGSDGSGVIVFSEFLEFYLKYFFRMEETGDGQGKLRATCPLKEFYRIARPYPTRTEPSRELVKGKTMNKL